MTNNKDLKTINKQFTPPPVPQTQEVRYIETEDLYPDLGYEDVSSSRGYGPCSTCGVSSKKFRLTMDLRNAAGKHIKKTVNDVDSAADEASNIISGTDGWEGTFSTGVFRAKNRNNLAAKVNKAIKEHTKDKGVVYIGTETNDVSDDE